MPLTIFISHLGYRTSIIHILLVLVLISVPAASPFAATTKTLSKQTYQQLQASQKLLEAGNTGKAVSQLQILLKETTEHPYEQAVILQTLAHAYISSDAYNKAIPYLQRSLKLNQLPDDVQQRGRYNLAQLYLAENQFTESIKTIQVWIANAKIPRAEIYAMLGSAYLQLQRYADAIEPMRKAIELNETPKENWYQSLLGAYNELKNYEQCTVLLREMITLFPKRPRYWRQLAGIEMMRENYSEALAVMELAYLRNYLEAERDLLNLAQLYSHQNAPYKAGIVIEKEIHNRRIKATRKNWELAANAWNQARETKRAINALEQAWKISQQPALGLRLSQHYLDAQRWKAASLVLNALLKKKKLDEDDAGRTWLLLGITRFETKQRDEAREALNQAAKYKNTRKDALQWLAALK
ncbi:MAG: tetratricopeptide repeat protein [Gammaproteobacteria bacterium]|nr:tetratricopeptide repeat protein [Gammaproteobacteria bacterium]